MPRPDGRNPSRSSIVLALIVAACAGLHGTPPPADPGGPAPGPGNPSAACASTAGGLALDCPAPPAPPAVTDNKNGAWDRFAWNTFAALNWPAGDRRGFPDLSSSDTSFRNAKSDDVLVWETYKEKREVFRATPSPIWDSNVDFADDPRFAPGGGLVATNDGFCSAEEQQEAEADVAGMRHFVAVSKLFNTLDETIEVASEALESKADLCLGHLAPGQTCETDPTAACCAVQGQRVGPRVWRKGATGHATAGARPLFYEVKVNYDFFDYVLANQYYDDRVATTAALLGRISLPYRTVAVRQGASQNSNAVTRYDPQDCVGVYNSQNARVPCRTGAVHLKSAWLELDPTVDDPGAFHTTKAIYFVDAPGGQGLVCRKVGTFGLLGLHIIQRVHIHKAGLAAIDPGGLADSATAASSDPNGDTAFATGGAFVFSTWEHRSIVEDTPDGPRFNYTYANFLVTQFPPGAFPTEANSLDVEPLNEQSRLLAPTRAVNDAVWAALPDGSVWRNYQLIGTQFRAIAPDPENNASAVAVSAAIGQPFHLANLVIETNLGLQRFNGIPPQQPAILPPQFIANFPVPTQGTNAPIKADDVKRLVRPNPGPDFDRDHGNLVFGRGGFNGSFDMGGCMGCHGVAQQNGYSFSFVLLGGQQGSSRDTQADVNIPPPGRSGTVLLEIRPKLNEQLVLAAPGAGGVPHIEQPELADKGQLWQLEPPRPTQVLLGAFTVSDAAGLFLFQPDQSPTEQVLAEAAVSGCRGGGTGGPSPLCEFWTLVPVLRVDGEYYFLIQNSSTGDVLALASAPVPGTAVIAQPAAEITGTHEKPDYDQVDPQLWRIEVTPFVDPSDLPPA